MIVLLIFALNLIEIRRTKPPLHIPVSNLSYMESSKNLSLPQKAPQDVSSEATKMSISRICDVYNLLLQARPGTSIPPDLYEILRVDEDDLKQYRRAPSEIDISGLIREGVNRKNIEVGWVSRAERAAFYAALVVMLDIARRQVYDVIIWPHVIEGQEEYRGKRLGLIYGWTELEGGESISPANASRH